MDVFDRPDVVTVIDDDSYNANPASTAAALRAMATLGKGRRTLAVRRWRQIRIGLGESVRVVVDRDAVDWLREPAAEPARDGAVTR